MKYFLFGGSLALIGACVGFSVAATFAPRYRIMPDGAQTWVCGNEYGDPGMMIGLVSGLALGLWLAYRSSRKPHQPI
jgi:hypothetical protein